ncbi:MAG: CRISPR-associated helicase Cas3' [Clostridia bacterium]|jgi:CRISPR-associated helicase Cas3/CRISPR-associated endonuclease Cas3-HD|nr:CRISPR-associated helicase Cas3' [bacterium]
MYYAHSNGIDKNDWQTLIEHLNNTAKICGDFLFDIKLEEVGKLCGLLHDLGKYSVEFQQKLDGKNINVEHSTAGAVEICKLLGDKSLTAKLLSYCITGHHTGLLNYGAYSDNCEQSTLCARLKSNRKIPNYQYYKQDFLVDKKTEINLADFKFGDNLDYCLSLLVRMIFSALVDADFLDTEKFIQKKQRDNLDKYDFKKYRDLLNSHLSKFSNLTGIVNETRNEVLNNCLEYALNSRGMFSLTVPTGGGKTLSSMAFAINHLLNNKMKRIIYVIPYTSIIEQNAEVFKDIFGENNVLEHHYNYEYKFDKNGEITQAEQKLKQSSENWDMPIIVTTNVQFFESLFSNKTSRERKLHNIINSVIIFDEVQMFPIDYLKPCLLYIQELVRNYKCSAVFCSATQPDFKNILNNDLQVKEIIKDKAKIFNVLKRVDIEYMGIIDDEKLVTELSSANSVLCILNTRKHVYEIASTLEKIFSAQQINKKVYYLTTYLSPNDRKLRIKQIKSDLEKGVSCVVVSTQLIEAGVDIDFPVVYRVMCGMDSVIQSAGRCNREGKLKEAKTYIFTSNSKFAVLKDNYLKQTAEIGAVIFKDKTLNLSLEQKAINYFEQLYSFNTLDKYDIIYEFQKSNRCNLTFNFENVAEKFHLIEDNQVPVIIPCAENLKILEDIKYSKYPLSYSRKIQPYTVSIYENQLKESLKLGDVALLNNAFYILNNKNLYTKKYGLNIDTKNQFLIG